MKKVILSSILFMLSHIGICQSWVYHPFPTDSAIWINANGTWNVGSGFPPTATLTMNAPTRYCMGTADTVIGSGTYSKINYCGGAYRGALRDDGIGKIYFIPVDSTNELLIYDFTVSAGNTVTVYETPGNSFEFQPHTYTAGYTDSILIGSSYRKKIYIDGQYWIEGVGCTNGLFTESWGNVSNWYVDLECMSSKNTTLYPSYSVGACSLLSSIYENTNDDLVQLFPNPTSGKCQIIITGESYSEINITDVLGKIIYQSELKSKSIEIDLSDKLAGIYFICLSDSKGNSIVKKVIKN